MRLTFAALIALLAAPAQAAHVYLNGVLIDGVTGQEFTQVERVVIDAEGNVRIEAPRYEIEKQELAPGADAAAAPAAPALKRRYWLVTTSAAEGVSVEIWAGDRLLRRIAPGDGPVVEEITAHLRPGANRLRVKARKEGENARPLPVLIGEAAVGEGDEVTLSGERVSFDVGPGHESQKSLTAR